MSAFAGRAAIVTGAGSGIGQAIGAALAAAGCDVGLLDVSGPGLATAQAQIAGAAAAGSGRLEAEIADVGDVASVGAAVDALAARLGRLDILVNCAGILRLGTLERIPLPDWHETMRVNVDGLLFTTRAALPHLRRSPVARIVNMSSWMGKSGKAWYGAYCASKSAIVSMTETLALELAEDGITVNAICPGIIMRTAMRERAEAELAQFGLPSAEERIATIPLKRLGAPEDVAAIALFLASDAASYMTGHTVNVTGGMWLK